MFSTPRLFARRTWTTAWLAGLLGLACCQNTFAAEKAIDLAGEKAGDAWLLLDKTASIQDGQLVLDGRRQDARAFYKPLEWGDCSLRAKFLVEPQDEGVLACGFVVRAADASTYYYVHFDRAQAILVRSDRDNSWTEIKRVGGLDKPAGQWHEGQLECVGDTLRVSLNGKLLYEAKDAALARGRIGFYASQGLVHVKDIVVSGNRPRPPPSSRRRRRRSFTSARTPAPAATRRFPTSAA